MSARVSLGPLVVTCVLSGACGGADGSGTASHDPRDTGVADSGDDDPGDDDDTSLGPGGEPTDGDDDAELTRSPLIDEAVAACVWTIACLNTEDDDGGAAPNTSVGSCIETFMAEQQLGFREPWDEFSACLERAPTTCGEFRACLLELAAICELASTDSEPDWSNGVLCSDGTRSCAGNCTRDCTATACAADGTTLEQCVEGEVVIVPCQRGGSPGSCVPIGDTGGCFGGETAPSSEEVSTTCDGDILVSHGLGVEGRLDCARLAQSCLDGRCLEARDCTPLDDKCDGETLRTCASGHLQLVDCTTLGATCGRVRGAVASCELL